MKATNRQIVWLCVGAALCAASVCDAVNVHDARSTHVDIVQGTRETPAGAATVGNRRSWTGATLQQRMMRDILGYPCVLLLGANGTYGCSRL